MRDMRAHFRPEFLNRVDEIVVFKPLSLAEITRIVDLMLDDVRRRLAARDISLEITDAAKEFVAKAGYDPVYGARPLRRYIQRELETKLGRALIADEIPDGAKIDVGIKDQEIQISYQSPGTVEQAA